MFAIAPRQHSYVTELSAIVAKNIAKSVKSLTKATAQLKVFYHANKQAFPQ
jgi:hypothetical protein